MWIATAVLFLLTVASLRRDPRTYLTGLLAFATAVALAVALTGGLILFVLPILLFLTVIGLGIFLIANSVTVLRREGAGPAQLLGLLVGLVMVGYPATAIVLLVTGRTTGLGLLVLIGLPLMYLGFAFAAYVSYAGVYTWWTGRHLRPVESVIVLGSGLAAGKVPPLLAGRLDRAIEVYHRSADAGATPWLIPSGGRGVDEPVAEATAMADYLVDRGIPRDRILVEDRSTSTAENLSHSKEILLREQLSGPTAVVTSNYHAFRAATLMHAQRLDGFTVGAPTARYYWPSAMLREFAAVIRDHWRIHAAVLGLLTVPFLTVLVIHLVG